MPGVTYSDSVDVQSSSEKLDIELGSSLRQAVAFLKAQAVALRPYSGKMSEDLVRLLFEVLWWDIFSCIDAALKVDYAKDSESQLVSKSLDMLQYAIGACLFLGMKTERRNFLDLLAKVYSTVHMIKGPDGLLPSLPSFPWFSNIMMASTVETVSNVAQELHELVADLKDKVSIVCV